MSDALTTAAAWLGRGQALEAGNKADALAKAIGCYDEAIAILRASQTGNSTLHRDLAVAWMNRGNALLKQNTAAGLMDAVRAYDETIALLAAPAFEKNSAARNSLGAAWMNRGLALHRRAAEGDLEEALRSHREAVAVLQTLPPGDNPWPRRNLAAAWTNLANALLDSPSPDRFATARDAGRTAIALVSDEETRDPIAADLALKARRCLCDALGDQLAINEAARASNEETAAEAGDTVDAALALIRQWEQRGVRNFRPLAERFFFFGAHFYRLHQPHFLAEFVLENLDPENSPDAMTECPALYPIAADAIATALLTLRTPRLLDVTDPSALRHLRTVHELQSAERRLAELRPVHPPMN